MRARATRNRIERGNVPEGPIRHSVLSDDLLRRIKAFKEILADVDHATLDEVVDDFKRDAHPAQEIAVWERIANTYAMFLLHNPIDNLAIKHEIYSVLVRASFGVEDWTEIRYLTSDQIRHLVLNYQGF